MSTLCGGRHEDCPTASDAKKAELLTRPNRGLGLDVGGRRLGGNMCQA